MVAVVLAVAVAHNVVGIAAARIAVDIAELLAVAALPLVVAAQLQRAVQFPEIQTQNRVVFGQMLVAALLVRVCVLLAFASVKLVALRTIRLQVKIHNCLQVKSHKNRPVEAAEEYCR